MSTSERETTIAKTPHGCKTHYVNKDSFLAHCGLWLKDQVQVSRDGQATCRRCSKPGAIAALVDGKFERLRVRDGSGR